MSQQTTLNFEAPKILALSTPEKKSSSKNSPIGDFPPKDPLFSHNASIADLVLESSPVASDSEATLLLQKSNSSQRLTSFRSHLMQFAKKSDITSSSSSSSSLAPPSKKRKLFRGKYGQTCEILSDSDSNSESRSISALPNFPKKPKSNLGAKKNSAFFVNDFKKYEKTYTSVDLSDSDHDQDGSFRESNNLIDAEKETLKFFNSASIEQLVEQTTANHDEAKLIIENRRYRNYDALEALFRKTKGLKASIANQYHDAVIGLAEIDQVIKKCETISSALTQKLETAGIIMDKKTGKVEKVDEDLISDQPESINPKYKLKDFQIAGVAWLHSLYYANASGILADEMGLGKTFQVIAMITRLKEEGVEGPHLIICPSSTLDNWLNEFAKFSPSVKVKSYYGNQMDRRRMGLRIEKYGVNFDVLVSTYNVATSNKTDRALLKRISFKSLILDEGHMIKNCTSVRYTHLMQIKAPYRLLLTGTPLQNNLVELISLLAFILPKVFVESSESIQLAFKNKKTIGKKSQQTSENEDQEADDSAKVSVPNSLSPIELRHIRKAQMLLAPFVLRRKKIDVLKDLPQKIELLKKVEMTESQAQKYKDTLKSHKDQLEKLHTNDLSMSNLQLLAYVDNDTEKGKVIDLDKIDDTTSATNSNLSKDQVTSWIGRMMELRKVANHPLLIRSFYSDKKIKKMASLLLNEEDYIDGNYDYILEDMTYCSDFELQGFCKRYKSLQDYQIPEEYFFDSTKVKELEKILKEARASGEKVLVFSQFTTVLDILEYVLKKWKVSYSRLDGQTKTSDRQEMIEAFNELSDIKVFLLSTKAGGFGINLASASIVVIHDIDINPHNDRQAEDRAHRVGQVKNVKVIKLIAKDTVEEEILEQANAKLLLDQNITNAHLLNGD